MKTATRSAQEVCDPLTLPSPAACRVQGVAPEGDEAAMGNLYEMVQLMRTSETLWRPGERRDENGERGTAVLTSPRVDRGPGGVVSTSHLSRCLTR